MSEPNEFRVKPFDLLARADEILSPEVLNGLARIAASPSPTRRELLEFVDMEALALIGVCRVVSEHSDMPFPSDYVKAARHIAARVAQIPGLVESELLNQTFAELQDAFESTLKDPDGGVDHYPNDEISAIRAVPFFLPVDGKFLPLFRVEILSERTSFPQVNLRLSLEDGAFIAAAMLKGVVDTLNASKSLAKHELLVTREVKELHEMIDNVESGLTALKLAYQNLELPGEKVAKV